jgi:transposase
MADGRHFTSWLSLAPGNNVSSGGPLLSSKTRRSADRAAALVRIAAVNIGETQSPSARSVDAVRTGPAKALTATARKVQSCPQALRFGLSYVDPGASSLAL